MVYKKLREQNSGRVVLARAGVAATPAQRLRGLLGRRTLAEDEGMYFPDCRMIHMFGMQMKIDAVFMDDDGRVLDIAPELAPWRIAFCRQPGGRHTLEMAAGAAARHGLQIGDCLCLED